MKIKNNKNGVGGQVVNSGGFGCVFNPALKCINNNYRIPNQVSKLMLKRHAESEYNDIIKFKKDLEKIPDYENYFLLNNFSLCEPEKLTKDDLIDYNKKCKTLQRENITSKNINKNLDKLISLNMPNGGIDLGDYFSKYSTNSDVININNSLIKLLKNGILPMNKLGIYHCDIKESNILIKKENNQTISRLIDWGLSSKYNNDSDVIPSHMKNRPFQYNVPFSCILFTDLFDKMYNEFLIEHENPEYYMIRTFVIDYIFVWNNERGAGHIKVIENIFGKLFSMDLKHIDPEDKILIIEMEYTYNYIIEYLTKILYKYTKNNKFYKINYFKDVYVKIVDIWGFIISYEPIMSSFYSRYMELNKIEMKIFKKFKYIFMTYLYEPRVEPININSLINNLKNLSYLFEIEKSSNKITNFSLTKYSLYSSKSKKSKRSSKNNKTNKTSSKKNSNKHNKKSSNKKYSNKISKKQISQEVTRDIQKTINKYLDENEEERTAT